MILTSLTTWAAPVPTLDTVPAVAWLESVAIEIDDRPGAPGAELAELSRWIDDAAVIGLGDGSHGTSEFYSIKHRLIEHLVRDARVRTIVFEGPWPEFNRINAYIQGGEGNPAEDLRSRWWFWNTKEILDLIEWARQWNLAHPTGRPIEFRGVDMAIPSSLLADLDRFLKKESERLGEDLGTELDCFREYWRYSTRGDSEKLACRRSLEAIVALLEEHASASLDEPSGLWEATRSAEMLVQAEALYRDGVRYDFSRRDASMAENIARLFESQPDDAPVVYWAHNGHVGVSRIPFHRNQRSTGSYLAERFGDRYYSIGSITSGGEFFVWDERSDQPVRVLEFPEPSVGSYEHLFAQSRFGAYIAPLSEGDGSRHLSPRSLNFGMGGPSVQQAVVDLREMFDAVIFVRHTTPTHYLGVQ